ncbi:MAG: hypothetical protein M0Q43_00040 [Methanothrix sp.]|jgi:hypothetical protein|nr:hypothetical protein [Methanothrix sp.]
MLKCIIEGLFTSHSKRKAKAKRRRDFKETSNLIACSGGFEEFEEYREFPETEACKLFMQCQWIACFHPGIDAEILRVKKYME